MGFRATQEPCSVACEYVGMCAFPGTTVLHLAVLLPAYHPPLGIPLRLTERKAADTRLEGKTFLQR